MLFKWVSPIDYWYTISNSENITLLPILFKYWTIGYNTDDKWHPVAALGFHCYVVFTGILLCKIKLSTLQYKVTFKKCCMVTLTCCRQTLITRSSRRCVSSVCIFPLSFFSTHISIQRPNWGWFPVCFINCNYRLQTSAQIWPILLFMVVWCTVFSWAREG